MSVLHLYDKLLQTPLFLGMSKDDLNQIVEHTKFGFLKFEQGKTIIREGEKCEHVYYLTNGCIVISKSSDDHSYTISEEIHAPYMFQLECLFGLTQQSSYNINSITACNMISIDKDELMKLSDNYMIFKINILNLLSAKIQKLSRNPWRRQPDNIRNLIIKFIVERCQYPAGKKKLDIHMETLAKELNDGRLNFSKELNRMSDEGLIILHRGGFVIPALERLLM